MVRVDVRLHYVVAEMIGQDCGGVGYFDVRREYPGSVTVESVLRDLALAFGPAFKQRVYDPEKGQFGVGLCVAVNGVVTEQEAALRTLLEDGSDLFIMPIYTGG